MGSQEKTPTLGQLLQGMAGASHKQAGKGEGESFAADPKAMANRFACCLQHSCPKLSKP